MNNLTKILLVIFLSLGIVFFSMIIFYLIIEPPTSISSNSKEYNVELEYVRVIENKFLDKTLIENFSEERMYSSRVKYDMYFSILNIKNNLPFAKTSDFKIESIKTPSNISFYERQVIPIKNLKDDFVLQFIDTSGKVSESEKFNFNGYLPKKSENVYGETYSKQIELKTTDGKLFLILFLEIK